MHLARCQAAPRSSSQRRGQKRDATTPSSKTGHRLRLNPWHADEPMTALAFSLDGSMLAAACGATITLWDVGSHALVGTLASPRAAPGAPFTLLAFLHHSPHLIASSGGPHPLLACWHLLSGASLPYAPVGYLHMEGHSTCVCWTRSQLSGHGEGAGQCGLHLP